MNIDPLDDMERFESEAARPMTAYEPTRVHYRKAAEWLMRLRENDLATSRGFERWKASDPANAYAFSEIEGLFAESAQPAQKMPYFFDGRRPPRRLLGAWRPHLRWAGMAIAACLLLMLLPIDFDRIRYFDADAITSPGEIRRFALKDGSIVTLNSGSAIKVDMSAHQRTIQLLDGEAYFEIAKDKSRPMAVFAGDARVHVVGTKFNIRIGESSTRVSVTKGLVRVAPSDHPQAITLLPAGQEAVVNRTLLRTQDLDTLNIEPWRHHRLILSYTPLRVAVREFNRYRRSPIILMNSALANNVVSGVFSTEDPADTIRILEENLGVESITLPTGQTLLY